MRENGKPKVAIACQGGGSHAAFAAGVLRELFEPRYGDKFELVALSGTSGGAVCASLAWSGLLRPEGGGRAKAAELLAAFWDELSCHEYWDAALNYWGLYVARLPVTFEISPYSYSPLAQPRLEQLLRKYVRLEDLPQEARRRRPALFIGATDIKNGLGIAFEGGDLTYDDIIASAAIPPLFRAVRSRGTFYWDGLFSRNPPIRDFLTLEEKPDEIWVIQINPHRRDSEPTTIPQIIDRRNELSGNLALDQELFFINKINELREQSEELRGRYKHITVRRVGLGLDLDLASKLDRDPAHIRRLMAEGMEKAPLFFEDVSEIAAASTARRRVAAPAARPREAQRRKPVPA